MSFCAFLPGLCAVVVIGLASVARAAEPSIHHPGLLSSRQDIALIKGKLAAGAKPWTDGFELLRKEKDQLLAHRPSPHKVYSSEPHWSKPGVARDLLTDARAVYGNTLLFVLTDDARHARKAEEIIDAWCDLHIARLGESETNDPLLFTSYSWPAVIWSAELLRAYDKDWAKDKQERFAAFLKEEVVPVAWQTPHVLNNWQSWAVCCRMACAIYLDDKKALDKSIEQWKEQLRRYIYPDGHAMEVTRDLWHTQMGMAPLLLSAEFAWHQGIDLYSLDGNRLLKGVEYHIPFIEGDLSKWPYPKNKYDLGKQTDGEIWWNMYELAYNHYHNRLGLPTSNTERVVLKRRAEPFFRMGWGTLMHAGAAPQKTPPAP